MMLRPRQKTFVDRCSAALTKHGNTLGIAPTGAGKTIMLSAVVGQLAGHPDAKACVLAHRDELTSQNRTKFERVNPGLTTSVVDAGEKSWAGHTTFAMVQTLSRDTNLASLPTLDLLVVDEAHHAMAAGYRRVIERAQSLNPRLQLFGVTATPNRGDGKGLRPIFSNIGDQIQVSELIASGHLVPPRPFVIDVGTQGELRQVKRGMDDFDMAAVEKIMNKSPINAAVVREWQSRAADRKTVVFCSTLSHAQSVTQAFCEAGVNAAMVHGELSEAERKATLDRYENGDVQVIVNVAVLTEGWDYPPTSCVVLLRPSSHKSTMIQMIGRGLRTVDPREYPGVIKTDCIVLDFGTSLLMHGSLKEGVDLDGQKPNPEAGPHAAPHKECPNCGGEVPAAALECLLCGHQFEPLGTEELADFVMSEVDLLNRSNFLWCDIFRNEEAYMAGGFQAWAGVFWKDGRWVAVGGISKAGHQVLAVGERMVCLAAADDWLNTYETENTAYKTKRWLKEAPTDKQLQLLPQEYRHDYNLTRYQASSLLTYHFNRYAIRQAVDRAAREA
jgi:superfamily II DNA or RNA helicase